MVHLVAYVPREVLQGENAPDEPWFLGFYCCTEHANPRFFIGLINLKGTKQRCFTEAGDSFEYAFIVATGLQPITPGTVRDLFTYTEQRLFHGHLSPERGRYRSLLQYVHERLGKLRLDYSQVVHARGRRAES